jgi:ribonuclease HI
MTTTSTSTSIVIFTDGACTGNPGPGGWASIVSLPDGTVHELGGGVRETTNNRMEMAAAIHALAMLPDNSSVKVILYTDSTYLIRGITQWIWGWRSKGWRTADGKEVANRELWEELLRHVARLKPATIDWKYVRGHSGYPGNERCDQIAVSFATGKPERLYVGALDGYFVDLTEIPSEDSLPDQKKNGGAGSGKKGAAKPGGWYLSLVNGVLNRHSTWGDCEKRVKGQSNAKFKKVGTADEQRETLRSWGLNPDMTI